MDPEQKNIGVWRARAGREKWVLWLGGVWLWGCGCDLDCVQGAAGGVKAAVSLLGGNICGWVLFLHPSPLHSGVLSVALHGNWPSKFTLMLSILNTLKYRNNPLVLKMYKFARLKKMWFLGEYISLSKMLSSPKLRALSSFSSDFQHTCCSLVMPYNIHQFCPYRWCRKVKKQGMWLPHDAIQHPFSKQNVWELCCTRTMSTCSVLTSLPHYTEIVLYTSN